tara:strand:- start:2735 stop:2920 length:186 start_codon:yes stop_codon:yes gene_type:complete
MKISIIVPCYNEKNTILDISNLKTEGFEQHVEILCKVVKNGKKFMKYPLTTMDEAKMKEKK